MSSSLHLEIAIVPASGLSAHERKGLEDWFQEEFGHLPYEWAEPEWYAVARSEDGSLSYSGRLRLWVSRYEWAVSAVSSRSRNIAGAEWQPP